MKNIKIEIIGAYGETNFGDDLLMLVFENFFLQNFPNAELNFIGDKGEYVTNLLTQSTYGQSDFHPDFIVYGGGTQFFSFSASPQMTITQRILIKMKRFAVIARDLLSKNNRNNSKPVSINFLGFGIGPFHEDGIVKEKARLTISKAHFVGVRDSVSLKYCLDWGIDAFLGADVVFSSYFKLPKSLNHYKRSYSKNNSKKKIGIIVRDWNWDKSGAAYINQIKNEIENINKIVTTKFIVFAPSKDNDWMNFLGSEEILLWDPYKFSIENFLIELNQFDGFISARYHGAILGCLLGKPVICIEIENKLKILADQITELMLWKKPFHPDDLKFLLLNMDYNVNYDSSLNILKTNADNMFQQFIKKIKTIKDFI